MRIDLLMKWRARLFRFGIIIILVPITLAIVIWFLIPSRVEPFKHEFEVVLFGTFGNGVVEQPAVGRPERIPHSIQVLNDHGWKIKTNAYAGLPPELLAGDLKRLTQAVESVGKQVVFQRDEYWFPVGSDGQVERSFKWIAPSPAGPVNQLDSSAVPILLWPTPGMFRETFVGRRSFDPLREASGFIDLTAPFNYYVEAGISVAREINFQAGVLSHRWRMAYWPPESALGTMYVRRGIGPGLQNIGWLIDSRPNGSRLESAERSLRCGKPLGGKLRGRKKAFKLNDVCVLLQVEPADSKPIRLIGYAFADGVPLRSGQTAKYPLGPSRIKLKGFASELRRIGNVDICSSPWPIRRLNVPTALDNEVIPDQSIIDPTLAPIPPAWSHSRSQSRFIIPEQLIEESTGVITIRKDQTWRPFNEAYIIENGLYIDRPDGIRAFVLFVSLMSDQDLRAFVEALSV